MIVRYRVKPDRAEENAELVRAVFAELMEEAPEGLRYATLQDEESGWFTHVASIETPDGSNPLAAPSAFERFRAELSDWCEVPPEAKTVTVVGNYRLPE